MLYSKSSRVKEIMSAKINVFKSTMLLRKQFAIKNYFNPIGYQQENASSNQ